jgi:ATP-dependent protease ClpP protease subunit
MASKLEAPPRPSETLPSALVTFDPQADAALLRVDGIITSQVAQSFSDILDSLPAGQPVMLELNSPGGYTTAGYALIDRIEAERSRGRAIATRVRGGESCESMCFGVFMAGHPRYAQPAAQFMVHAPRGLNSGTVTLRSTGRMIDRMLSLGVDAAWIQKVAASGAFDGTIDHRETAAELAAENANVVTDLLAGD